MRARLAVLAVVAAALAAPAEAQAVDHVWLSAKSLQPAAGWALSVAVTSPDFDSATADEIVGVTLAKRIAPGAVERHALRLHRAQASMRFDGRQGRWRLAGSSLAVDMAIRSTSEPLPVGNESLPFGCRGSFQRRLITLHGTFALRTGTAAFRTIRRVHLTGVVTYNAGGPVACGSVAGSCNAETSLLASAGSGSLSADPARRTLVLTFRGAGGWYHVLELSRLVVSSADLPEIRLSVPSGLPVAGSLSFSAREREELVVGGCRVTTAVGDLAGRLRVTFTAWGARTFAASSATYRRSAPA